MGSAGTSTSAIALPKGGGALRGLGEKFAPDLHTGTGNFTIPLTIPPGRNGLQPQLDLVYSTGTGNGPFGLGWGLSVPGVARKVSRRVPRYRDGGPDPEDRDTFVLSGREDLVQVGHTGATTRYRPRTEGPFARIERHRGSGSDYWKVWSRDGLVSYYGTPGSAGNDPAVVANPAARENVFGWRLSRTVDPFGNRIVYNYRRDLRHDGPHHWDQLYLQQIRYVDFHDAQGQERFLVSVRFEYDEVRADAFSDYRSGFEIRTRLRCNRILVATHPSEDLLVRTYELEYDVAPHNGVSLLRAVRLVGHDGPQQEEELPALTFGYTAFEPDRRDFFPLEAPEPPPSSLASPDFELVDLTGDGLPDVLELGGAARYWPNAGNGRLDLPRLLPETPAGLRLADPGVQVLDADGDGRADLLITNNGLAGYFPLRFDARWDRRSFQPYPLAPSFNLEDPEVRLVDLDGDGLTDVVRSGARFECFFNHPDRREAWRRTTRVERRRLEEFPDVAFSDPRVRWADMTGDGLQDIVLIHDENVEYWPNLGHGRWGKPVRIQNEPDLPFGYDPRRLLLGDVDGDGLADLIYVDDTRVTLWINQSGNRWSAPIVIEGTPAVADMDAVRLADVLGSGVSGLLWSRDVGTMPRPTLLFLDFTGGTKPYLLNAMDNHLGAVTRVAYAPSTRFYVEDQQRYATRWKTPLPFPVQVVARVEAIDQISGGKLTTEYRYHHGYWDGVEREFRGFGRVDQLDTQTFERYHDPGLHPGRSFEAVAAESFSPPTETRTWFHLGAVDDPDDTAGGWTEAAYDDEFWPGDPPMLEQDAETTALLKSLRPRDRRDALRSLRGRVLRTELYGRDGSARAGRPYTVTEQRHELALVVEENGRGKLVFGSAVSPTGATTPRVFFPHASAQRTTQWERGDDPLTRFTFTDEYDNFGQPRRQTEVACPRGWRIMADTSTAYLATRTRSHMAGPLDEQTTYIFDRVAKATSFEIALSTPRTVTELRQLANSAAELKLMGQTLHFYDGDAFVGLPSGQVGKYGALMRTETLVLTEEVLQKAYGIARPPYLSATGPVAWTPEYPQAFRNSLAAHAGYVYHAGDAVFAAGHYVATERRTYDFQVPALPDRGLVVAIRPPLGQQAERDTRISHDDYRLLPVEVTDPVGLTTRATYDYRVLQPRQVTEPNGNHTRFTYSPLGLLGATWQVGKAGEGDGAHPSLRLSYRFREFMLHSRPIYVHLTRREHHDVDRDETIQTREYSDGFGRLLQSRVQAEDELFGDEQFGGGVIAVIQTQTPSPIVGRRRAERAPLNVVVSGWQTYDNKGRVVEKFEPFFDTGWDYAPPDDERRGAKVTVFHDPRGRVVRTVNPDGSEQRVILGVPPNLDQPDTYAPTPWEVYTYDANDNAGRTHAASAQAYKYHWNTPTSIVVDGLGRTVETVELNRMSVTAPLEKYRIRMTYDTRGNLLTATDTLGRPAFRHVHDLTNRRLQLDSIDAGVRRTVPDAAGNVVEQRDGKGALVLCNHDVLNRPSRLWARDAAGGAVTLRERLEYGDDGTLGQPPAARAAQRQANRLGKPHRHYDEAGLVTFDLYDFKGNLLDKMRRVVKDAVLTPGWVADWDTSTPEADLGSTVYRTTTVYDALNRITSIRYPQDVGGVRKELEPRYNRAGALESVRLDGQVYVRHIAYNARGQRILVVYGNGVLTGHAYDPQTFRLKRLWTGHSGAPAGVEPTYLPGQPLQDMAYVYDLIGNIWHIHDRAPGCGLPNQPNSLDRSFTYDAVYHLRTATGRECNTPPPAPPWDDSFRCHDVTSTRAYSEAYLYDDAGNIEQLQHSAGTGSFTRVFTLLAGCNRLDHMTSGTSQYEYEYDANGNVVLENAERHFEWDHGDRLKWYRIQAGGGPPSVDALYLYDAGGQRVKKLVRKQSGQVEVTVYIDGLFEHHVHGAAQNNTLHVMDGQTRIATARVGAAFPGDGAADKPVQYHLGDHLANSHVVVGGATATGNEFVNREEYTAFGETCFGSFARKRYRFTGKERDREHGLSYHRTRYYAPWLGRWLSCDRKEPPAELNLYAYVENRPTSFVDPDGTDPQTPQTVDVFHRTTEQAARGQVTSGTSPRTDMSRPHAWGGEGWYGSSTPEIEGYGGYDASRGRNTVIKQQISTEHMVELDPKQAEWLQDTPRGKELRSAMWKKLDYEQRTNQPSNVRDVVTEMFRQFYPGKNVIRYRTGNSYTYVVLSETAFRGKPELAGQITRSGVFAPAPSFRQTGGTAPETANFGPGKGDYAGPMAHIAYGIFKIFTGGTREEQEEGLRNLILGILLLPPVRQRIDAAAPGVIGAAAAWLTQMGSSLTTPVIFPKVKMLLTPSLGGEPEGG